MRFVKEFLLTAPTNKQLTFGGDYATVETVVGPAAIARQGLGQALSELVSEGWLAERAALDLVEPLMRGNARSLFPIFGVAVARIPNWIAPTSEVTTKTSSIDHLPRTLSA